MNTDAAPWGPWVEPWYFISALQGVVVAGMAPMLFPLAVVRAGSPLHVGLVMAAFSLGGLTASLWGRLAGYLRWPQWLLIGGFLLTAAGLVAFAFTTAPAVWVALALLQGSGAARANTMANSFIVEARPQQEWEQRIGWLQTFYGGGQVAGLLLTGCFSRLVCAVDCSWRQAFFHLREGLRKCRDIHASERWRRIVRWIFRALTPKKPQTQPKKILVAPRKAKVGQAAPKWKRPGQFFCGKGN